MWDEELGMERSLMGFEILKEELVKVQGKGTTQESNTICMGENNNTWAGIVKLQT